MKVVCTTNYGNKASLTIGKVYKALSEKHGMYQIVDDSAEVYYFPKTNFAVLPKVGPFKAM